MAADQGLPRGTKLALFAMGLGVLVIANDFTALNVALPAIEQDFDVDVGTVQWVVNGYVLVFGMGLVTGGRLADMLGRRLIFFIGAAIFAGFSILGAIAPSAIVLIIARVGMGVGGALLWPAILGMTFAALPPAKAGLAGGLILGVAGLGNAVGPLIGGVLTDELSWRAIFWLNVPIAALAVFATAKFVHQPPVEATERKIDYAGIVTVSLGLVAILLGLDQAVDWGWTDPRVLAFFGGGLALLIAFAVIERRVGEAALIPPDVIANKPFRAACLTVLMLSAVFFSIVLYVPQLMEKILGFSALEAGVAMLPMLGLFAIFAFFTGRIYERVGGRPVIITGTALLAAGPLVVSFFGADSSYAVLIPGLVLVGIGAGFFYPSITTAAVTMLDASRVEPRRRDHLHVSDRRRGDRPRADHGAVHEPLRGPRGQRGERRRPDDDGRPGRGDPRLPRRHRAWERRLQPVRHLGGRQGPRRGQGLVRRRHPAQPAGRRGDRPGRPGDRDSRSQGAGYTARHRTARRRLRVRHGAASSRNAADAPGLEVLPLLAAELGLGLVRVDPLAHDPVPVALGAQLGEHRDHARSPSAGPSARRRGCSRAASPGSTPSAGRRRTR